MAIFGAPKVMYPTQRIFVSHIKLFPHPDCWINEHMRKGQEARKTLQPIHQKQVAEIPPFYPPKLAKLPPVEHIKDRYRLFGNEKTVERFSKLKPIEIQAPYVVPRYEAVSNYGRDEISLKFNNGAKLGREVVY